jgi:hypothetical protein
MTVWSVVRAVGGDDVVGALGGFVGAVTVPMRRADRVGPVASSSR